MKGIISSIKQFYNPPKHPDLKSRIIPISKDIQANIKTIQDMFDDSSDLTIKNISLKTVYKGIAAYGLNRGLDKMISQGIEEAKNTVKDFAKEIIKKILEAVMAGGAATEVNKAVNSLTNMTGGHMSAACPAAGI